MKISLSWLKKHIDLPHDTSEVVDKLTFAGLEVEHVEEISSVPGGLKGIIVGEVLECKAIPDTNKLKMTKVLVDPKQAPLEIICGAPNADEGLKVAVAPVGTTIYPINHKPIQIKKAKIRGHHSHGMLCAEDEIGLGQSHDGIMILPDNAEVGQALTELFDVQNETVLDIGLTANRGDAASHRGVARDLAALYNRTLLPLAEDLEYGKQKSTISLDVQDADCPRYMGLVIENVSVKESPKWLQEALRSIDIEPINNIVDITNYVLHDLGQPIHAFDLSRVEGNKVVVRKATKGEKIITLDGKERTLSESNLVIANQQKPMAIAGVFGGADSGISTETKDVFIESAYFSPVSIRKTAKSLGLSTDASYRYERGTDPNIVPVALNKVAQLITQIAGGNTPYAAIEHYPEPISHAEVTLDTRNVSRIIGIAIPVDTIKQILNKLDIVIDEESDSELKLLVPPLKSDVTREIDVIEEIIRIHGFENIPLSNRTIVYSTSFEESNDYLLAKKTRQLLQGAGFTEIMNNSMIDEGDERSVKIQNPLSADTAYMRRSLENGIISSIGFNSKRKNEQLKLFEIGTVFLQKEGGKIRETQQLAIASYGSVFNESWQFPKQAADELYLSNIVDELLKKLGVPQKQHAQCITLPPSSIDESKLKKEKIKGKAYLCLLNLNQIAKNISKDLKVKDISNYPAIRRDLSLVLDESIEYQQIAKLAKKQGGSLLRDMNVFDVFKGKPLEKGKKSYSVSFKWQSEQETLQDTLVDQHMSKLMQVFEDELNATIRK